MAVQQYIFWLSGIWWAVLHSVIPPFDPQWHVPVWCVKSSPGKLVPLEVLGNWGRRAASF